MSLTLRLLAAWCILCIVTCADATNMNGEYVVASGDRQGVAFNTDYASKGHEYFDIYSEELATRYGDVYWHDQGNLPVPDEIVSRFAGKVIAITGYEHDQVMVQPQGQPGKDPDSDVSVPINWAYNHHYMLWMTGNYSSMNQVDPSVIDAYHPIFWVAVDTEAAKDRNDPSLPTSQLFSEGNGGESRKSFHGYPDGYAQLIESPQKWHLTPMQIDTRNRDCGATIDDINNCTQFKPGVEPKQARYGRGVPSAGTNYSGLLECPCSSSFGGDSIIYGDDTKTKIVSHDYVTRQAPQCNAGGNVLSSTECFQAVTVTEMGFPPTSKIIQRSVSDSNVPLGCSVRDGGDDDSSSDVLYAYFNSADKSSASCSTQSTMRGWTESEIGVRVEVELDTKLGVANISVSGPSNAWFGVGFNATVMADQPYALILNESGAMEQKIGTCGSEAEHCPGDTLITSIKVLSNTVVDSVRTVTVQRAVVGKNSDYYTFAPAECATIPLITAVGSSQQFAYHKNHSDTKLSLVSQSDTQFTCVCDAGADGQLCNANGTDCKQFVKSCVAAPAGDLLAQNNPTCNSKQYSGGLQCGRDGHNLLDADQAIPASLLRYHLKFRFWFQEYKPAATATAAASHFNLERVYQQTEANAGEYDVPPAFALPDEPVVGYPEWPLNVSTPGTHCNGTCPGGEDCECEHVIEYRWSPQLPMRLIYAGGHCHAPSCISLQLYRNDTGELLCEQLPITGQGNVEHDKYDEAGYIAIPPCLWGNDTGLNPSMLLPPNTPLLSVKRNKNTQVGHFGEMASWQMRATNF